MKSVAELFTATAANLSDTMTSHGGAAGFRIPDYQRTYDWDHENIKRLLEDCLNGFAYFCRSRSLDQFTFLGTLILVRDRDKESTFDGMSLSIVDGQQRLTTLMLLTSTIVEFILYSSDKIESFPEKTRKWLIQESDFHIRALYNCLIGQQPGRGEMHPFPRIVRDVDTRGKTKVESEYRSYVSRFLMDFCHFFETKLDKFDPSRVDETAEGKRFFSNYDYIRNQISHNLLLINEEESDLESDIVEEQYYKQKGAKELFEKLSALGASDEINRGLEEISSKTEASGLIRLLLFSSYLTKCVALTRVETDDPDAAFEIFDALNTTGEPLTALETLKPRVIQFEKQHAGYRGSESEQAFDRIENNLNKVYPETEKRQKETKELIVSFALYLDGSKQPLDLSTQRSYLRNAFDNVPSEGGPHGKRKFIASLADIAQFRRSYWDVNGIDGLANQHPMPLADQIQLCCSFISNMNTSLAIPIMARYWVQYRKDGDEQRFLDALKAIAGFIALRRAATGGTSGIDSDLRSLMSRRPQSGADPLCSGLDHSNKLLGIDELRAELKRYLSAAKVAVTDKESWVNRAAETPILQHSRPLCRLLLLAAAHHSMADEQEPGLWRRQGIRPSDENEFLNYRTWQSDKYATVEHVAPDSNPGSGWDDAIYRRPYTRHTLGNAILLPQKENSSVGNAGWPKKRIFYLALTAKTEDEQAGYFEQAKKEGFDFKKKTQNILKEGGRLRIVDPIAGVPEWTEELIQSRTRNILELAWEQVGFWVFK